MNVLKGTYRISLNGFIKQYSKNIRRLEYTDEEAKECIDFLMVGVLQFLKVYVVDGKLYSCCKLMAIARDFLENKFADKDGRYFKDYDEGERFYIAECLKFDYMEVQANDYEKKMLVNLIEYIE